MRSFPNRYQEFFDIAKANHLSYPKGRALYACNRLQNGWPRTKDGMSQEDPLNVLAKTKESTAKRWIKHWNNGGSIKILSYPTAEAYNKERRKIYAERRCGDCNELLSIGHRDGCIQEHLMRRTNESHTR